MIVSAFRAVFASFTNSLRSIAILFIIGMGAVLFEAVLALVTSVGNISYGTGMLLVYSVGMSLPVLSISYYGKKATGRHQCCIWSNCCQVINKQAEGVNDRTKESS